MGSTAAMNIMMSWLKGLASWVLDLFNLAGSTGFSPLGWLSNNWIKLLFIFLAAGVSMDIVVWLARWRPHWVWFRKKRIVIHDDNFFAGEELVDSGLYDPSLFFDPEAEKRNRPAPAQPPRRRITLIERVEDDELSPRRPSPARRPGTARISAPRRPIPKRPARKADADPLFHVERAEAVTPESGEDAVFNVSDLPVSRDELALRKRRRR